MDESLSRREMVSFGASLYNRGYIAGSAGNMSVRIAESEILMTPSGSCMGRLEEDSISKVMLDGALVDGHPPTKEIFFHLALYRHDPCCNAIVHLHSTWSTVLSCLADLDPDCPIRPMTPYYVMKIGHLQVIPYFPPGDQRIADEMVQWAGKRSAFLLRNHGAVVIHKTLEGAVDLAEELEETAKIACHTRSMSIRYLTEDEIHVLKKR